MSSTEFQAGCPEKFVCDSPMIACSIFRLPEEHY